MSNDQVAGQDREAFVLAHALRGLDRQATVLGELRQRANIVLSATGVIASLLGGRALDNGHPLGVALAAMLVTALGIGLCVLVLMPVRDQGKNREWKVTLASADLKGLLGEAPFEPMLNDLIAARRTNHQTISTRSWLFIAACSLLPLQMLLSVRWHPAIRLAGPRAAIQPFRPVRGHPAIRPLGPRERRPSTESV